MPGGGECHFCLFSSSNYYYYLAHHHKAAGVKISNEHTTAAMANLLPCQCVLERDRTSSVERRWTGVT